MITASLAWWQEKPYINLTRPRGNQIVRTGGKCIYEKESNKSQELSNYLGNS